MFKNYEIKEKKIAAKILQVLVEEKANNQEVNEILFLVSVCYKILPVTSVRSEVEEVLKQLL
jgi:hypothetical protein